MRRTNCVRFLFVALDEERSVALQPRDCWDRGFESRLRPLCLSHIIVVRYVGSGLCDQLITCSEESHRVRMSNFT